MREITKNYLEENGAVIHKATKKLVHMRLPARGLLNMCKLENPALSSKNQDKWNDIVDSGDSHNKWCGGSLPQLHKNFNEGFDLHAHRESLSEIQRGVIGSQLRDTFDSTKVVRKLKTSDVDGDFIYTRRFEDKPFVLCKKEMRPSKIIEIEVNLSFSCGVESDHINKFGAFTWALINLIEAQGRLARLIVTSRALKSDVEGKLEVITEVVVKDANQYVSPSQLAACLSSLFMRRALFSAIIMSNDLVEQRAASSLGSPKHYDKPIEFRNGKLFISGDALEGDTAPVIKAIKEALTCKH